MKVYIIELQGRWAANGSMAVAANNEQEARTVAQQVPAFDEITVTNDSKITELKGVRSGRYQPGVLYTNYNPY